MPWGARVSKDQVQRSREEGCAHGNEPNRAQRASGDPPRGLTSLLGGLLGLTILPVRDKMGMRWAIVMSAAWLRLNIELPGTSPGPRSPRCELLSSASAASSSANYGAKLQSGVVRRSRSYWVLQTTTFVLMAGPMSPKPGKVAPF